MVRESKKYLLLQASADHLTLPKYNKLEVWHLPTVKTENPKVSNNLSCPQLILVVVVDAS
jgi:hypothetical protein